LLEKYYPQKLELLLSTDNETINTNN